MQNYSIFFLLLLQKCQMHGWVLLTKIRSFPSNSMVGMSFGALISYFKLCVSRDPKVQTDKDQILEDFSVPTWFIDVVISFHVK